MWNIDEDELLIAHIIKYVVNAVKLCFILSLSLTHFDSFHFSHITVAEGGDSTHKKGTKAFKDWNINISEKLHHGPDRGGNSEQQRRISAAKQLQ